MLSENINTMNKLEGFDVIIVCCSSQKQADYWQDRLERGKGSILSPTAKVLAVEEDWPGGAGNALGTLYAFVKANILAKQIHNIDLLEELKAHKISVSLYHTAGKGTRLAPLPGSENNNKPGVKLPTNIPLADKQAPITILEAVIKQTGCYAKSRPGRLSVFWGDQVFIPSAPVEYKISHHIDILCALGPMMTEEEWKAKGMDKYGLIAACDNGKAAQVEKVDHSTALQLLAHLGEIKSVGTSLGSFSISWQMLDALLKEFNEELTAKKGKLDSDPHLWMPMTLDKEAYVHLMKQKGIKEETSSTHFERIQKMMNSFNELYAHIPLGLFGPVDVGQEVLWWDYGQLKLYQRNTLLMTQRTKEAELMRSFFGVPEDSFIRDSVITNTNIDEHSCLSSCTIGVEGSPAGFIKNSVLTNVRCNYIEAENCILVNVTADKVIAKPGSIIYNVLETPSIVNNGAVELEDKQVVVGVFDSEGNQFIVRSDTDTDGGKAWETKVAGNEVSFEEVYNGNMDACPKTLERVIISSHDDVWNTLSNSGKQK